jgi:hypothetical protein
MIQLRGGSREMSTMRDNASELPKAPRKHGWPVLAGQEGAIGKQA